MRRRRWWWWFERREDEIAEELAAHLAMAIRERTERGEPLESATAAARREFGNRDTVRATTRDMWGWVWLEQLVRDARYAARRLRMAPGFTAVAALSLAIGIGATVTMYAVIDAADIRALPYPHADRLVVIEQTIEMRTSPGGPPITAGGGVPAATFADWQRSVNAFDAMARDRFRMLYWPQGDETEALQLTAVSANFFDLLRAVPQLGRAIVPSDTNPDANGVLVLSDRFWRERFAGDRGVIGREVQFAESDELSSPRESYTIVGVMPAKIDYPGGVQGWVADRAVAGDARNAGQSTVLARLREGRTFQAAVAELSAVGAPSAPGATGAPASSTAPSAVRLGAPGAKRGIRAKPLRDWLRMGASKESFTIESVKGRLLRLAIVGFVLLIAVINVGNLMLARSAAREHEMAVRTALGASRARLAQQLLVEGGCIAVLGGAVGVALATWGVRLTRSLGDFRRMGVVPGIDARAVLFAVLLTGVVAIGTGLIPVIALRKSRDSVGPSESPRPTAGRVRGRLQGLLLVGQVAAALTLLTGAALLAKELLRLDRTGFGFDPTNVVWFSGAPGTRGTGTQGRAAMRDDLLAGLARVPGVQSVSEFEQFGGDPFFPLGDPSKVEPKFVLRLAAAVNPGFLTNLRIPLLRGRDFSAADFAMEAPVAVVSASLAARFWPGEDPIGKEVVVPPGMVAVGWKPGMKRDSSYLTVVGVMGNARFAGVLGPPPVTVLWPYTGNAGISQYLVRTNDDSRGILPAILKTFAAVRGRALARPWGGTVQQAGIDRQLAKQRLTTRALIAFAAVAMLLSALGLHGLVSYAVTQRTREIGVRMALGAESTSVMLLVTKRGILLAAAGIALGLAGSYALGGVLSSMLYGTSPTDPLVFGGSAALLAAVVAVASYLPARHATRVDPMISLRVD